MTVDFELPWPPSVNHYYRHVGPRVLISREGRRYRDKVIAFLASAKITTFKCPVEIHLEFYPPDHRRRDLDNLLKCILDSLQHACVYQDDSQIYKLTVIKREPMPPDGMAYIRITEWKGDKTADAADKSFNNS